MLEEIIAGVEMDLSISRYATWDDLRLYCYRVASAVGLVSIEIFGYKNSRCKEYAIELGLAVAREQPDAEIGEAAAHSLDELDQRRGLLHRLAAADR